MSGERKKTKMRTASAERTTPAGNFLKARTILGITLVLLLAAALFCGAGAADPSGTAIDSLTGLAIAAIYGGTYYLNADISGVSNVTISADFTLDLNGKTLTAASDNRLFTVISGKTFTLKDSVGVGKLTGGNTENGGGVYIDGTFNMEGGSITGCTAEKGGGVYVDRGTFTMTGGSITNCKAENGGGVYVYDGKFTMEGSSITGCTAGGGGGVYLSCDAHLDDCEFTMKDDSSIKDCTAEIGGGVYVNRCKFTMYGGSIKDCKAENGAKKGGGVHVYGNSGFYMSGGSITGCTAELGGGVSVFSRIEDGTADFFMWGGEITGCEATEDGGGVFTEYAGSLTMYGGSIKDCKATGSTGDGGGVFVVRGMFDTFMSGGEIKNCTAVHFGGGVYFDDSPSDPSKFKMEGGSIINCTAENGGGVYNCDEFTMEGGSSISGCTAENGGGVYNCGEFTMEGSSSISGCTATYLGGGVYNKVNSEFTMKDDSSVTGCKAYCGSVSITTVASGAGRTAGNEEMQNGGGVYNDGMFAMYGGSITGCTAANNGSGAYNNGTLTMSGMALIGEDNDIFLGSDRKITLGSDGFADYTYGARNITSKIKLKSTVIVDDIAATGKLSPRNFYYKGDIPFSLIKVGNQLILGNAAKIEGGSEYVSVNDAFEAADAGDTIVLLGGSILRDEITIDGSNVNSATLDLNGSTLYAAPNNRLFTINSGASFNLTDSIGGGRLTGGNVTGSGGAVSVSGGTFTMNDGSITDCTAGNYGGAVSVYGGTFTMKSGSIADCSAVNNGGGIYISGLSGSAAFTMESGSISACTADLDGGGVYALGGAITIKNGEITGCKATQNGGGGVGVNSGTLTMEGGEIKNCEAVGVNGYAGGAYVYGTFTMSGGSITGCKGTMLNGGVCISPDTPFNVSGSAEITGNTLSSGEETNLYLWSDSLLNLIGDFTGSIGISYAGAEPAAGLKFGTFVSGTGAENFFADKGTLIGTISGTDLRWPAPTPASGGSSDTGSGNYSEYPRTADGNGGVISFGTSKNVKALELPAGVKGEVTLRTKTSEKGPEGEETLLVFEINIRNYPEGTPATILYEFPLGEIEKTGHTPADYILMHKDSDTEWSKLPTTYEVTGTKAVYTAVTTAFSPFAVVYAEGAAKPAETEQVAEPTEVTTAVPTEVVTEVPTAEPVKTAAPTAVPTEAPKSPLALGGILAGLAAAGLLFGRRE